MFPPIQTGTSFYTKNLAEKFTEMGHQVTLVTLKNKHAVDDNYSFQTNRLKALHIPIFNFFKHFRICSFYPQNYFILSRIAKKNRSDVILLVNHYLDIAFPAIIASLWNGIPLICSVGTQLQSANPRRNLILKILDRLICGITIFPFCDKIIAWDKQIEQYLKDRQGKNILPKIVIINYGVNGDINYFLSHKHDYHLKDQILGIGSIIDQRNFIPLIKAFKNIAEDYPEIRLKIIGHIYYKKTVKVAEQLNLGDRIEFTGELSHDDVLDELKKSDIYFVSLTGEYVGLGTATIEAMLMGIPAIANVPPDLLGDVELVDHENYLYCDSKDIQQVESRIRTLLSSSEKREKIGQNGRKFISENLKWDKVVNHMEQLFMTEINNQEAK